MGRHLSDFKTSRIRIEAIVVLCGLVPVKAMQFIYFGMLTQIMLDGRPPSVIRRLFGLGMELEL
jgi:hypothetical protein